MEVLAEPLHAAQFSMIIRLLPVSVNEALCLDQPASSTPALPEFKDEASTAKSTIKTAGAAIKSVIRSKGFCWLATYHAAALYWSHAGSHFELKNVGSWCVPYIYISKYFLGDKGQNRLMHVVRPM